MRVFFKFAWNFLETASSLAWLEGMVCDMEWQTVSRLYVNSLVCSTDNQSLWKF